MKIELPWLYSLFHLASFTSSLFPPKTSHWFWTSFSERKYWKRWLNKIVSQLPDLELTLERGAAHKPWCYSLMAFCMSSISNYLLYVRHTKWLLTTVQQEKTDYWFYQKPQQSFKELAGLSTGWSAAGSVTCTVMALRYSFIPSCLPRTPAMCTALLTYKSLLVQFSTILSPSHMSGFQCSEHSSQFLLSFSPWSALASSCLWFWTNPMSLHPRVLNWAVVSANECGTQSGVHQYFRFK